MNLLSILSMLLYMLIAWVFVRFLAPYEKNSTRRYVSLKSKFLSKLLIPKGSGYVKVKDRQKISLFSLISYIFFGALFLTLLALFIIPTIPCEDFKAGLGKHGGGWWINTLNEKLIFLLPMIYFYTELLAYITLGLPRLIKSKKSSRKSLVGFLTGYVLMIVLWVFVVLQLFL